MMTPLKSVFLNSAINTTRKTRTTVLEPSHLTAFTAPVSGSAETFKNLMRAVNSPQTVEKSVSPSGLNHLVHRSIDIAANAEDIFNVVTCIEGYTSWAGSGIETIHLKS